MNTGDLPLFQKQKIWSLQNHFMKKLIDGGKIYITVNHIPKQKRMEASLCFKESKSHIIGAKFLKVNNTCWSNVDSHSMSVYYIYCKKKI